MCNKSESIKEIAMALVKFNGEVSKISKAAENPFFKSKYATLDDIVEEVRPILTKYGLSILQFPGGDGENVIMKTMLLHESGEWIESDPLIMKPVKSDPQAFGSCVTYARRYSLNSFLSLNTGEDDDGNKASQPDTTKGKKEGSKASVKAKYQLMYGNLDKFEEWHAEQSKKYNDKQIEFWLTTQLKKRQEEVAHA
jgi:hypothetical protein